jgi:hypothetical protein
VKEEGRRKKEEGIKKKEERRRKRPFRFAFPQSKNKEEERTESTLKKVGFK